MDESRGRLTPHPTLVALIIGGLVLAGGIALIVILSGSNGTVTSGNSPAGKRVTAAAASPSSAPSTSSTPSTSIPSSPAAPITSRPSTTPGPSNSAAKKPITYVVKRGDNLTVIARWFHQHGYGALYDRNKAVIGDNPNLIFPGQRLTISGGKMTLG